MKQWRKFILLVLSILLVFISWSLVTAPSPDAQMYPMFPFLYNPWAVGIPLLPAPIMALAAPRIPFFAAPVLPPFLRSAAVVTTTTPVVVTATAPVATLLPPSATPAGLTLTSLIPVTAPVPVLPLTTTTYGVITALVLAGTSPYTVLSFLLL